MSDLLKGWKNLDEVSIPPIERKGFSSNVIIRKPVEPIISKIQEDNATQSRSTASLHISTNDETEIVFDKKQRVE